MHPMAHLSDGAEVLPRARRDYSSLGAIDSGQAAATAAGKEFVAASAGVEASRFRPCNVEPRGFHGTQARRFRDTHAHCPLGPSAVAKKVLIQRVSACL